MKTGLAIALLCVIAGCADGPARVDTTGPHPALGKEQPVTPDARTADVDTGRLQVDSPKIPNSPLHTGYMVFDENGLEVAHAAARAEGPVEIKLAPGRYFIRLDQAKSGPRDFWVTVKRDQVTRVDNEGWNDVPASVR